ncbi:MAG TPA: TetR/AcrR family transcriptional regulator [Kofleriaceae bacterium]|jgi:AcrR family transcriptional regulator|nr:TetR/AcrR family transcriptional regulator [Kofleriaceae bacterium]
MAVRPRARAARAPSRRARPRATYHHGDLRRELVRVALALVDEGQGDSFTLREAARRVGVNHRAVYHHFADKRELLAAIAIEGYEQLAAAMHAAVADLPPTPVTDRLLAVAAAYVRFAHEHPAHYRVMFGPRLNRDGRFPTIEAALQQSIDLVGRELSAGFATGELAPRDTFQATLSLWAALHGVAQLILDRRIQVRPALIPRYAAELVRPMILGLAAG